MDQMKFCHNFLRHMLDSMDSMPLEQVKALMKDCSDCHYKEINMDMLLEAYIGNVDAFIHFLAEQWGWIVSCDYETGIIIADENKDYCVCPIVAEAEGKKVSENMCYCSEGFAERMFSKILGYKVEASIVSSVLRGGKHCVYEIRGVKAPA